MTVIVDYGMGNLASVLQALEKLGMPGRTSSDPAEIAAADFLILPGVGSFKKAMQNIRERGLDTAMDEAVLVNKKPFLGICLGMQLIADKGYEDGETAGLGWVRGEVKAIPDHGLRIPHIGWNDMHVRDSTWLGDLPDDNCYFIHSYYFDVTEEESIAATVNYGEDLVAAVHKDNIYATQFHPEKSQEAGLKVLSQFLFQHA